MAKPLYLLTEKLDGIEKLIMMDSSHDMVKLCKDSEKDLSSDNIEISFLVGDKEFLPIQASSVDLVISCLGLHWTNDLPGAMIQSRVALKHDLLSLAAIFGGETLKELRIACTIAHMEREGGVSLRISPLTEVVVKNKETRNHLKELNAEKERDMECVRQRDELYRH
ncbi:putative methyltransferase At1g22800, mitochondrial [Lactuca sativa]|uniref:putative methyltransferase At1g22800, mitochondrial n=1 Tax=Lactuca sativa TaxID=4236 RepID=UPI001C68F250|nr:putative methyltransferase At1g22800, mitochondrial [Lactuca sativa]